MLLRSRALYYQNRKFFNWLAIFNINKLFIICYLIILIFSIICLISAEMNIKFLYKQIFFILLSLSVFLFIIGLNIKILYRTSYVLYLISFLSLLLVLVIGKNSMGASRWLNLGFISFQPSEFAKLSLILFMARFISSGKWDIRKIKPLVLLLFIVITTWSFIVMQPDLATSIIFLGVFVIILFTNGLPLWIVYFGIISVLFSMPIFWYIILKDYQKLRIINFLNPENDPLGSGYNVIQSKIAIGSGGLTGKGFMNGTQGKLSFLPEHHTDFVFTTIGEEFGFIGSILVLLCYFYIILYGFYSSVQVNNIFGKIISVGSSILLFLHVFINVGMSMALMPVAGIPLPMLSYGGTMLLVGSICCGLIINASLNGNTKL